MVSFIDLKVLLCIFVSRANKSFVGTAWKNPIIQLCVDCIAACLSKASLPSVVRCGPDEVPVSMLEV